MPDQFSWGAIGAVIGAAFTGFFAWLRQRSKENADITVAVTAEWQKLNGALSGRLSSVEREFSEYRTRVANKFEELSAKHTAEIDELRKTHRAEIDEMRRTHQAEMKVMRENNEGLQRLIAQNSQSTANLLGDHGAREGKTP